MVIGVDKLKKTAEDKYRIGNIHTLLLNSIFNELLTNSKLPYITFSVFRDLLMETNIHKTCVRAFDSGSDNDSDDGKITTNTTTTNITNKPINNNKDALPVNKNAINNKPTNNPIKK